MRGDVEFAKRASPPARTQRSACARDVGAGAAAERACRPRAPLPRAPPRVGVRSGAHRKADRAAARDEVDACADGDQTHARDGDRSRYDGVDGAGVRSARPHRRARLLGVSAALPAAGLGGARRGGDLARHVARRASGTAPRRHRRCGRRRARHHESARDDDRVGSAHRCADRACDRVAGSAHRRPLRRAQGGWPRRRRSRQDRSRPRPVLLRNESRVDPRQRAQRTRPRRARRPRVRHRRRVAHLEADRRARARDRPDERLAHAPLRHPQSRVGPGFAGAPRCPRGDAPRGAAIERRHRRDRAGALRGADSDRRRRR